MSSVQKTPLYEEHVALKGKMIEFCGWQMPVQYSGLVDEHHTVRQAVGLFDVSHMGEFIVEGPKALEFLQYVTTNDVSKLVIGQAQYSAFPRPEGGLVDDVIVYRRGEQNYLLVVNAANIDKDFAWLQSHLPSSGVSLVNDSPLWGQIAVQGPRARELVQEIVDVPAQDIAFYHFKEGKILGVQGIVARTGYTGELGFELYVPAHETVNIWRALLEKGQKYGVKPCGLGARDTLRLEVCYMLYGNDIDDSTTPLEAGLGWITKLDKGEFLGSSLLRKQKEEGLSKSLVGLEMVDKAIARHGYSVYATAEGGDAIGVITSGSPSPSTGKNVAMAYVPKHLSKIGTEVWVMAHKRLSKAVVVKRPFYTEGTVHQ